MKWLLVLALLFLLGTLLTAMPSRRQRQRSQLRSAALQRGLQVHVRPSSPITLLEHQAAYCLKLPSASTSAPTWRLLAAGQLNAAGASNRRASTWQLEGWLEEGTLPALNADNRAELDELLAGLASCADAMGTDGHQVFVIWDEQGKIAQLDAIARLLAFLSQLPARR